MEPAGTHRLDLCRVRLNGEELDVLAGDLFQVRDEGFPDVGIDRRVLDRSVGKDQRVGIDQIGRIAGRVGHKVAVGITVKRVERAPVGTVLRQGAAGPEQNGGADTGREIGKFE